MKAIARLLLGLAVLGCLTMWIRACDPPRLTGPQVVDWRDADGRVRGDFNGCSGDVGMISLLRDATLWTTCWPSIRYPAGAVARIDLQTMRGFIMPLPDEHRLQSTLGVSATQGPQQFLIRTMEGAELVLQAGDTLREVEAEDEAVSRFDGLSRRAPSERWERDEPRHFRVVDDILEARGHAHVTARVAGDEAYIALLPGWSEPVAVWWGETTSGTGLMVASWSDDGPSALTYPAVANSDGCPRFETLTFVPGEDRGLLIAPDGCYAWFDNELRRRGGLSTLRHAARQASARRQGGINRYVLSLLWLLLGLPALAAVAGGLQIRTRLAQRAPLLWAVVGLTYLIVSGAAYSLVGWML